MEETISPTSKSNKDFIDFLKKLKKVDGPRKHKISKSIGMAEAFSHYRKTRPNDPKFVLARNQYDSIINEMNLLMIDKFISNKSFILPCGIGKLFIDKRTARTFIDDNDNLICTRAVDIKKTHELWFEDEDAYADRKLVRVDTDEIFRIKYKKSGTNISRGIIYFNMNFGRDIKSKLKNIILTDKKFDAYEQKHMDRY